MEIIELLLLVIWSCVICPILGAVFGWKLAEFVDKRIINRFKDR